MVTDTEDTGPGRAGNFPEPRQRGWAGTPPPRSPALRFIGAFAHTGVHPVERMGMRG